MFFNKKYTFTICMRRVWIFLIKKNSFLWIIKGYFYTKDIYLVWPDFDYYKLEKLPLYPRISNL